MPVETLELATGVVPEENTYGIVLVEYTIGTVPVEILELATGVVLEYKYGIVLVEYTTGTVPIECTTGIEVEEYT